MHMCVDAGGAIYLMHTYLCTLTGVLEDAVCMRRLPCTLSGLQHFDCGVSPIAEPNLTKNKNRERLGDGNVHFAYRRLELYVGSTYKT